MSMNKYLHSERLIFLLYNAACFDRAIEERSIREHYQHMQLIRAREQSSLISLHSGPMLSGLNVESQKSSASSETVVDSSGICMLRSGATSLEHSDSVESKPVDSKKGLIKQSKSFASIIQVWFFE